MQKILLTVAGLFAVVSVFLTSAYWFRGFNLSTSSCINPLTVLVRVWPDGANASFSDNNVGGWQCYPKPEVFPWFVLSTTTAWLSAALAMRSKRVKKSEKVLEGEVTK
jgi:hypothetical protein